MRTAARALVVLFASTAMSAWVPSARAEGAASSSAKTGAGSAYKKACDLGNVKVLAHDLPGAIEQYRKAIDLSPKQALAYYLLGEAELAAGSLPEAETAWMQAAVETGEQDAVLRARVLFVLADLKERQRKWDEARAAWQAYLDWATSHPHAHAFPGTAQSRAQVIDSMMKQDKSYEIVRQRIEETKAGSVFTDLSKPPPASP